MSESNERAKQIRAGLDRAAEIRETNTAVQANKGSVDKKPNRVGVVELSEADVVASGNAIGRDFTALLEDDGTDEKTE